MQDSRLPHTIPSASRDSVISTKPGEFVDGVHTSPDPLSYQRAMVPQMTQQGTYLQAGQAPTNSSLFVPGQTAPLPMAAGMPGSFMQQPTGFAGAMPLPSGSIPVAQSNSAPFPNNAYMPMTVPGGGAPLGVSPYGMSSSFAGTGPFSSFLSFMPNASLLSPPLAFLHNAYTTVGSFGAITELIGMNADVLYRVILGASQLCDVVGAVIGEWSGLLPKPEVRLEQETWTHNGVATTQQVITPKEIRRQKRYRLVRWVLGVSTLIFFIVVYRRAKHHSWTNAFFVALSSVLGFWAGKRVYKLLQQESAAAE